MGCLVIMIWLTASAALFIIGLLTANAALAVLGVLALIAFFVSGSRNGTRKTEREPQTTVGYPYRPDVERRLSNGQITTNGYAAVHPAEFVHWAGGRNVRGEVIDETDWENWRVNDYGM